MAAGGGKAQTFTRPVYGREWIARLLPGFGTWLQLQGAEEMRLAEVNGQPGRCSSRAVTNPEKLRHLDPSARRPGPLAR